MTEEEMRLRLATRHEERKKMSTQTDQFYELIDRSVYLGRDLKMTREQIKEAIDEAMTDWDHIDLLKEMK